MKWLRPDLIYHDDYMVISQRFVTVNEVLYKILVTTRTEFSQTKMELQLHRLDDDWVTLIKTDWLEEAIGQEILDMMLYGNHPEDARVLYAL